MKKNKHYFGILFLLLPILVWSQNTLTVTNTLNLINQFHPIAKQASLKVEFSKASLLMNRGAFDPSFYLNDNQKTVDGKNYFNYSNPEIKIPTWYGIEIKAGYENNNGYKLNNEATAGKSSYVGISVPLLKDLLFDKRRSDLAQSKLLVNASVHEKQLMLNDLFLDGASAYWSWVFAYQKEQLFKSILINSQNRLNLIKKSFQSGDVAEVDTVEGLLQLQNLMNLQSQAWSELKQEQSNLSNFLWDANQIPYNLNDNVIPDSSWLKANIAGLKIPNLFDLIDSAFLMHPKLSLLKFKSEALKIDKKYKTQNLLPTLRINYNFLNKGYEFPNEFNEKLFVNNYKAGIQFGLPIFLRQARGELKQANIKIEQNTLEFDQTKLEIENKIKKYYAELLTLQNQNLVISSSIEQAKKLVDIELEKYAIGESSLFLVNTRELKYIDVLIKSYELKAKFFKTFFALNWSKGAII